MTKPIADHEIIAGSQFIQKPGNVIGIVRKIRIHLKDDVSPKAIESIGKPSLIGVSQSALFCASEQVYVRILLGAFFYDICRSVGR